MGVIESITAAASRIVGGKGGRSGGGKSSSRAPLAWDMYETVPEVGAYAEWISAAMSGATLFAGRRAPDGTIMKAPAGSRAAELVAAMAGGPDGQAEMLGAFGTQLAVTGDSWVVVLPDPDSDNFLSERWLVLSTEEVTAQRGGVKAIVDGEQIEIPEYNPDVPVDPDTPVAFRVWKPSPRRHMEATSPVIRSLAILEELRLLNAAVAAIARSRITGRGLLLVPAGSRFPGSPGTDDAEDSLLETMVEVMSTAIREPESAAATTPIVLELPGDLISGVKWIQFNSEFDAMAIQLREEAICRFATGADVPAEVLTGLGDASHWGAWAITAEALRMGAEPKLALVCQALTSEWLQPILEADKDPEAGQWMVWYDTANLRSSSNKGASAIEAYKADLISGRAARRELGFTEMDAPAGDNPETGRQDNGDESDTERTELPVNETQAPPAEPGLTDITDAALAASGAVLDSFTGATEAALAEAVDGLVWGALTAACRKMTLTPLVSRQFRGTARELIASGTVHTRHPVTADQVRDHGLLTDAWIRVPSVAARYGLDPVTLAAGLDGYVTGLLVSGQRHVFDNVPRLLTQLHTHDVKVVAA